MQHEITGLRRRAGMRTKSYAARPGRTKLRAREQLRPFMRGEAADRNEAKSFLTGGTRKATRIYLRACL
jgi:hypothetical protein